MKRSEAGRRWRPRRSSVAAIALIVGALILAGCGGSSGGGSTSATTASGGSSSAAEGSGAQGGEGTQGGPGGFEVSDEQRACLKEKGVELPEFKAGEEPPGGEGGEMTGPPEGGQMPEGGEGGGMPEGGPPSGGEGNEEMQKAFEECGVETPEFKGGPGGEGGPSMNSAAFKKQVKEYVACVRENGYELAEPDFSGEGPIFEKSESESAAFKKASEQCQGLLGGPQTSGAGGETEES